MTSQCLPLCTEKSSRREKLSTVILIANINTLDSHFFGVYDGRTCPDNENVRITQMYFVKCKENESTDLNSMYHAFTLFTGLRKLVIHGPWLNCLPIAAELFTDTRQNTVSTSVGGYLSGISGSAGCARCLNSFAGRPDSLSG